MNLSALRAKRHCQQLFWRARWPSFYKSLHFGKETFFRDAKRPSGAAALFAARLQERGLRYSVRWQTAFLQREA
jgi:hypothetical protein